MKTEQGGDKIPIQFGIIEIKTLRKLLPLMGQANKERSMERICTSTTRREESLAHTN